MRDLESCKAEVFRRSENRIKERTRRRRRALTLCVPLVLCLVVGAAVWPALMPGGVKGAVAGEPQEQRNSMDAAWEKSVTLDETSAAVRTDDAAAAELLRALAPPADCAAWEQAESLTRASVQTVEDREDEDGVRIVLETAEGEEIYTLSGDVLTCRSQNWQRQLTEEEEMILRQTLGLPQDDSR